jgi:DUF4097 and DUF4098 domain-containing protein YvlB
VLTFILLGITAASAQRLSQVVHDEQSFKVSGTPSVRLSTGDGHIRVESWDRSEVQCKYEKRGRTQSDIDRIEIMATQNGDSIQVEARIHGRGSWLSYATLNLTVFVPRQTNLVARTGDGNIDARGVTGEIELATGDGRVEASNLNGNLNVRTGDGSMELMDVAGRLQAQTGDGWMKIRGRFEALEARTGDGSIEITVERGSKMAAAWRITTGDGSVQVSLPDDLSADLDVQTNDGTISTDLPVTISGRIGRTLQGRLNQGGNTLTVRTGDGSITLKRS